MTLLQDLTLKNIDKQIKDNKRVNLSKAMKDAGYTEQGSKAGNNYERLRGKLKGKFDFEPEETKRKILDAQRRFKKAKDSTNECRMIELEARIAVPELRRTEIHQTNPDKIIIAYGAPTNKAMNTDEQAITDESKQNSDESK